MISAILFDIDGTLIDSGESLSATYGHVCVKVGLEANFEAFRGLLGKTLPEIFSKLHPEADSGALVSSFTSQSKRNEGRLRAYDGAVNLVSFSVAHSDYCGYLTSKDEERAQRALTSLGFPSLPIFSPTSELRPKPHPDLFTKAREVSNLTRGLYIGDTSDDLKAARGASFDFIFAMWGYGQLSLDELGIDCASSPNQALEVIRNWIS